MKTIRKLFRKGGIDENKSVHLAIISRTYSEDGTPEYIERVERIQLSDLPEKAVHITGKKGWYALVDMYPDYPDYIEDGESSEHEGPINMIDANGYYLYFMDSRLNRGFDALGEIKNSPSQIEPQKLIIVAVVAVVGIWIIMRMMSG